jgi:outer membrane immunogenic protein
MQMKSMARYIGLAINAAMIPFANAGELSIPPPVAPEVWWTPGAALPPPLPRFSWTGCHLGAHVGGGFAEEKFTGQATTAIPVAPLTVVIQPPIGPPTIFTQNQSISAFGINDNSTSFGESGMLAGAQAGCDLQVGPAWVVGIDAEASGGNISGNKTQTESAPYIGFPAPTTTSISSTGNLSLRTNFISTVTGRFGYSVERGRGLFYAKAGAAFANNSYTFAGQATVNSCNTFVVNASAGLGTCTAPNPSSTSILAFTGSEMRMGWTVGAGIEWAVLDNWSIKLEYDYLDFGTRNVMLGNSAPSSAGINVNQRINEVKLGVNYLFGW